MSASEKVEKLTVSPAQSRAARALLDWSQEHLAEMAGIHAQALYRFERGFTQPHRRTLIAIRHVLEAAGVQFIDPDGAGGPGVRLANAVPNPENGC